MAGYQKVATFGLLFYYMYSECSIRVTPTIERRVRIPLEYGKHVGSFILNKAHQDVRSTEDIARRDTLSSIF